MTKKIWRYYPDHCMFCGSDVEVYTFADSKEGWIYDQDPIRCTECDEKGQMSVAEEDDVWISWEND